MVDPDLIDAILGILLLTVIFGVISWVVLSFIGWRYRRAYNLIIAESVRSLAIKPDFLTVDHAARKQALDRAQAFDQRQSPPAALVAVSRAASITRRAGVTAAILSFIVAIYALLPQIVTIQRTYERLSSWERFVEVFQRYPAGFVIAGLVILLHFGHLACRLLGWVKT